MREGGLAAQHRRFKAIVACLEVLLPLDDDDRKTVITGVILATLGESPEEKDLLQKITSRMKAGLG